MPAPVIFLSAVSRELRSQRAAAKRILDQHHFAVIEQDTNLPPDYRTLPDMMRHQIARCDAVVHLAGMCHGMEPMGMPEDSPRRSITQMEYHFARELNKPCYVFILAEDFPYDPHEPEPEEARELQLAHRSHLSSSKEFHDQIKDINRLHERLHNIRLDLDKLRETLEGVTQQSAEMRSRVLTEIILQRLRSEALHREQNSRLLAIDSRLRSSHWIAYMAAAVVVLVGLAWAFKKEPGTEGGRPLSPVPQSAQRNEGAPEPTPAPRTTEPLQVQLNSKSFSEGDEMSVTISAQEAGYLYVFSVEADNVVRQLYPSDLVETGARVEKGRVLRLPDDLPKQNNTKVVWRMAFPNVEGNSGEVAESIIAILSPEPKDFPLQGKAKDGEFRSRGPRPERIPLEKGELLFQGLPQAAVHYTIQRPK